MLMYFFLIMPTVDLKYYIDFMLLCDEVADELTVYLMVSDRHPQYQCQRMVVCDVTSILINH